MDYCFQIKIKDKVVCNIPQKSSKNLTRTVDLCSIISCKVQRILCCHHCWHVVSALHPLCRSSHSHSSSTCSRNCWHFRRRFNANRWAVGHVVKLFVHYIIQGKPLTVKCEVSDSESGGVFTWKIGNEIIRSMSRSLFLLWKHFIVKTFLPWNTNKPRKVWSQVWLQSPTVFSAEEASKEGDRIVDSVRFVPEKKVCDDNMMTMWWHCDDNMMTMWCLSQLIFLMSARGAGAAVRVQWGWRPLLWLHHGQHLPAGPAHLARHGAAGEGGRGGQSPPHCRHLPATTAGQRQLEHQGRAGGAGGHSPPPAGGPDRQIPGQSTPGGCRVT